MTRHGSRRVTALLACTAALTGAALSTGGAAQAAAPAKAPTATTCTDPKTGVPLTATIEGDRNANAIWGTPGSVVNAFSGDDWVFSDLISTSAVVCLGDGSDNFNPSDPTNVSVGTYFGVSGQNGNDNITGGTGNDYLFGDSPDNASHSGNDTLIGGPGYDVANGGPGIDRCDAEVEINCEL
ncbi:hypothetical protein [Streptomyces iranensis]|uniref:Ca2+-binding RTX toxin-like protein n=1 Tax=Streptomyces iranensis TaxID=576784 RepID=A0A061A4T3_9ACTN|nr:hypothetical protein [Streptomyces iranensis]MBP2064227.1 Ca2+-binding RTX toxin-like protein [Streptomyces iranensis]CDR17359.1 predicted protein [Streptomyces iranensis]